MISCLADATGENHHSGEAMEDKQKDPEVVEPACVCTDSRRRRLLGATMAVGGGLGVAASVPFVASLLPAGPARFGGELEVDISALPVGKMTSVAWREKPVWILRRSAEMLDSLRRNEADLADPASERADQPAYVKGAGRSIREEIFVCIGLCTHLGCSPSAALESGERSGLGKDWPGGFICPCHGARFDLAGRVFKGMIASANLAIPPHSYLSDTRLLIGNASGQG